MYLYSSLLIVLLQSHLTNVRSETCVFDPNSTLKTGCPGIGSQCTQAKLCATGYCSVEKGAVGQGGFTGTCSAGGPSIDQRYKAACTALAEKTACSFQNPIAMSPRSQPSYLQCRGSDNSGGGVDPSSPGLCYLGPQKHGDGCTNSAECASGYCVRATNVCKGIELHNQCIPGSPDPCAPGSYCLKTANGGTCEAMRPLGAPCETTTACARGTFCASLGGAKGNKCTKPFSLKTGDNTTLGPFMCESANALVVSLGSSKMTSIFQCQPAPSFKTNSIEETAPKCLSTATPSLGYECKCANDNEYRLTTIGGLGLGARVEAWNDLFVCLEKSKGVTGESCMYDSEDMENIRYGSCAYYACYPYYLKLAQVTGARFLSSPLLNFERLSDCEIKAAQTYYTNLANTPCISLEGLSAWACSSGVRSLSVAATNGVLSFIFIFVWGSYLYHMWYFRKVNGIVFPCKRLND